MNDGIALLLLAIMIGMVIGFGAVLRAVGDIGNEILEAIREKDKPK